MKRILNGIEFEVLDGKSAKAKKLIEKYKKPSLSKINISKEWEDKAREFNSILVYTSGGSSYFSCAFAIVNQDKNYLAYITVKHKYLIEV